MSPKEKALLNKIYRAVHDGVCPKCGDDMETHPDWDIHTCLNYNCRFTVTPGEMGRMREVIVEWGKEAVAYFEQWKKI